MDLKYLDKSDFDMWDEFVQNSPQGSIFSKSWYLNALQVDYKILSIIEQGKIKVGIVLVKNEINIYSNPMLDKYLGILLENRGGNLQKKVSKEYKYIELLSKELMDIKSFDYYFHPEFKNWIPLFWNGFTQQTRYTYRISNIENSIEQIYSNFHGNIKNDIKNAKKAGVIVKENIPFLDLWHTVEKTFLRQGGKSPYSKDKLEYYISSLSKKFISYGAYYNNECIAVIGVLLEKKSSYLLLNGIDIKKQVRGANAYLIYSAIKSLHNRCDYFDFEGSMLPGVEQFYRRFGATLTPYYRVWNDNFLNFFKIKVKKIYKNIRYGR